MLRRYTPDPSHVVDWGEIEVDTDGTFEEGPVCKTMRLVRVLLRHRGVKESIRATYPFLFRDKDTWFSCLILK